MLCATIHEGKIIVGCQYGLLVFWDTAMVLAMEKKVVGMHHAAMVLYEHSAAISNIHVDATELITDDYDGIVILRYVATLSAISMVFRNLRTYRRFGKMFRRGSPDPRTLLSDRTVL